MSANVKSKRASRSAVSAAARRRNGLRGGAERLEERDMLAATPHDLAVALTHSPEHYTNVVQDDYQHYLSRGADAQGLQHWVSGMQQGLTEEQLEASFIGSPEYIANHGGSPSAWVSGMYHDLLGRDPDAEGHDSWVRAIESGASPSSVAYGFAASHERESQRITNDYVTLLGRAPSAEEVDAWVGAFEHGGLSNDDVVAGFIGSPEYYHAHGGNKADFLNAAYHEVLHRDSDSDADHYWLDEMGASFEAYLSGGSSATGKAEYSMSTADNEFQVEIRHATPNTALNVTVNSVVVGQVVVNGNGEGKLSYSSHPHEESVPFPANFPQIDANTAISVGAVLSGNFQPHIDG